MAFYDIFARTCAEVKILREAFRFLELFFPLSFFSFSLLFAAVIDLLPGPLAVKKQLLRKRHRGDKLLPWSKQPGVVAGNFASSFPLIFLCIFVHISGSIRPITLIWASLERSVPPAEVDVNDASFGQK